MNRRIERAEELAKAIPAAAEMLRYYIKVVGQAFLPAAGFQPASGPSRFPCPHCGGLPVLAVLRPEGDGGKRSLLCSVCDTEWEFRRLLCPACGEEDPGKLPIYLAEEFPHVRVEACDSCHRYLKCIDLTRNGLADPVVDEIAAVALDVWANENGYTKLQLNLVGI